MLAREREGAVEIEPLQIGVAVAWLIALPVALWWSWVLFTFVRAQRLMASCEVCVSPNYIETREAFTAAGIYSATANIGWLSLIPGCLFVMPLSLLGLVLFSRARPTEWRTAGLALTVANIVVPIAFMILAQDQINWISDFTD